MTRCKITTQTGRRCKLPCLKNKQVCTIHKDVVPITDSKDVHESSNILLIDSKKACTHESCLMNTDECCGCSDKRPFNTTYYRFVDCVGDVPIGKREDGYCSTCIRSFASENSILDRFRRFVNIEAKNIDKSGLAYTARRLTQEVDNLIKQLLEVKAALAKNIQI